MAGAHLLLAAALAQTSPAGGPDFKQLWVFATIERRPSFEKGTRIRIGTFDSPMGATDGAYWFVKGEEVSRDVYSEQAAASSKTCPAVLPVLKQLERLRLPQPDVPGIGRDYDKIVMDGVQYRLNGTSRHVDGQPGDYAIESNTRTPLAKWADALFRSLDGCWSKLSP